MAASGTGRGRGWLNLNKNANSVRPGGIPSPTNNHIAELQPHLDQDNFLATFPSQYAKIVSIIGQVNTTDDDGILLNQKLKHLLECWKQACNSTAEVEESFTYLYQKCLQDASLATKLIKVVSLYSFVTTEIHNVKIRSLFIGHIQQDFENGKHLQSNNAVAFRNSVKMLSEFYHKARLVDGRPIKFLIAPLLQYFDMLLESAQPADLELFTMQLNLNGSSIKEDFPQKISDLMFSVRQILINNSNLTQTCRIWMLLALDVVNNRFGLLPAELHKFYQEHLGDQAMANFQGSHTILSVQTSHTNKTLDGYQSSVSVLQVTPPESTSPISEQSASIPANNSQNQHNTHNNDVSSHSFSSSQSYSSQTFNSESSSSNNDWFAAKDNKSNINNREKVGRPILGAGARLQKSKVNDETNKSEWKHQNKDKSTGWDGKHKNMGKNWGGSKKPPGGGNKSKGWEHDDRFENDYK